MSTVCVPKTGELLSSFAEVAKHYQVIVKICPSFRGWRKGGVEKANHTAAQRWWRTLADETSPAQAQAGLDRFCASTTDERTRVIDGTRMTVAAAAAAEPLQPAPATPFPAVLSVERTVSAQALVAFRGNQYSVPPGHAARVVAVRHQLGNTHLDVVTPAGTALARHHREPDHAGVLVRATEHVAALERKVLAARAATEHPRGCRPKERRPPSQAATAEAARLRGDDPARQSATVVDFAAYAAGARPICPTEQEPGRQGGEQ